MDDIDRKIIKLLSEDARRSLSDIGNDVGLAPSSVNERIKRLGASGTLKRFTIETDPTAIGLPVLAFIWVALREDADEDAFRAFVADDPHVTECHHVTGAWSYLIKTRFAQAADIEPFLAALKALRFLGRSETILALSSPVPGVFIADCDA
ncbi:MAG: Lrp/AsnC family transcriptional regulator [Rhodobacter sp.]|nr:Lrp/AsnC family transcriptional regulator [Rhodobacter sp.]